MTMARRLTTIARYSNENVRGLSAYAEKSWSSTDRKPAGCPYITSPGKGRSGYQLIVWVTDLVRGRPSARSYGRGVLLIHDSSQTYRTNNEVEEWLAAWERAAGTTRRIYHHGGHHTVAPVLRGEPWPKDEEE